MADTLTLSDQDLKSLAPVSYNPVSATDVSSVSSPPPPLFRPSNTDVQAVSGTQQAYVPPPAFGGTQSGAGTQQAATDDSGFPDRVQAVGGVDPSAFIVHHTSGRGTVDGVLSTLASRGLGVQYIMDRDARIYRTGGPGAQNILTGWGKGEGLSNKNVVGMEIIANDDKDVTPKQAQTYARFMAARYPNTPIFGHGEVNPGHKEEDEGQTAKAAALALRGGQELPALPASAGGDGSGDPNKAVMLPPGVTKSQGTTTTNFGDTFKQLAAGGLNATRYGYPDDPWLDSDSAKGNGAYVKEGGLIPGYDVALNAAAAAKVGNPKPGEEFTYAGRKWRYGDKVPEKYTDARFDIFDPHKEFGPQANAPQFVADGDTEAQKLPASFGMRVATPADVQKYGTFLQNGGDPNNVPIYDRLAIAIAQDPNFLTKPENFEEFYGLVYKPLRAQNMGAQFNKAVQNLAPGIWQTIQNVGAATGNAILGTYDQAKLAYQKATGTDSVFGQSYSQTAQDLAQRQASMSAGIGQGSADAYNFVTGLFNGIASLPQPLIESAIHDPAAREEVDRAYASNLQMITASQQQVHGLGKALQGVSASAYGMLSAHAKDMINAATPDPNVVAGTAALSNPMNVLPISEGLAAVGAFRPVFFERAIKAGEEAAGAIAKKGALDATQILPQNVMDHAANPAFADAANARAAFTPQANAAADAATQTQNDLAAQLTRLGKTEADPGTAMGFLSQTMQTGGKMLSGAADIAKEAPEQFARWVSGGNPVLQRGVSKVMDKVIFGALLEHLGWAGTALEALPDAGGAVGDLLSITGKELGYGQTSLPFWTRVAQQTNLVPKWAASALDHPLVQTATQVAKGGVVGAGTGAALGFLSTPTDPMGGAVSGAGQGGILGMAGAGFGQWQRFQDPNQYVIQARGDWKRYRDTLPPTEQQSFDKLSPTNQLVLGQSMQHFPGLSVSYLNDANGPRGAHYIDPQGRSNIQINLAHPDSAIAGVIAHELIHNVASHGQLPDIYDALLGNPRTGQAGQFTDVDAQGQPIRVNPQTGRYVTNAEFDNFKREYMNALGQSGIPTSHLTDLHIAQEMYAEHGVDYMLSGGAAQDAGKAFRGGLYSANAMKAGLAKVGFTFDDAGNIKGAPNSVVGTGLFTNLQRNETLANLAKSYFQKRFHEGKIDSEEQPTRKFSKADMQNPAFAESFLQNAPEIRRDKQGNVMRDPNTGLPIYRSQHEVTQYNADFAAALGKGIESLPPERLAELGFNNSNGNTFVRYLPNDVLDAVAKDNQFNPHQIAALRMLSNVLADKGNPGAEVNLFYHKALTSGKKYGQFEGSEKIAVPYGFEITQDGNVNVKSVDFAQLNNNYLKARNRPGIKGLWESPSEFTQDVHTYFTNHAEGRQGTDGGLGEDKRNAINALGGFGTQEHKDANPLVAKMPKSTQSIIKSYRIDRASQIQATGSIRPFISEDQYRLMNSNYLPKAKAELVRAPADLRTQSPERQAEIVDTQNKAQAWLDQAGEAPVSSTATYLKGDRALPAMENQQDLGEHINANHPKIDITTPAGREEMAHSFTYDVMHALTQDGNAMGWYGDTVDRAMAEVSKVDPDITATPENEMMFKVGLAISSQGQKIHPNFETAYHLFQHFKENGEMPEGRENFGPSKGGKDAEAMEQNLIKVNRLRKELGAEGLQKLLLSHDTVANLQRKYGVKIGGDAADEVVVGSKILGPKVGAFFANLNGNFDPITMDLWLARGIHRMEGEMFNYSETAFRDQIGALRDQINNDEVPAGSMTAGQRTKILRQIDTLEKMKPGTLTRERAQKSGKAIDAWAQQVHSDYAKNIPGRGSYKDGTPSKRTAKAIDERLNKISDDPGGVQDRTYIKDIYARVQDNMRDAGINISNADLQALTWYREQQFFKQAGVLSKGSDNIDYLDGAYALGKKHGYAKPK